MSTLFATTVANAKPQDRDYKLSDGGGLYLLVRANGTKLWRLNYRYLGKYRTLAFGTWPEVSLADARSRRDEARSLIAAGLDPSHEQKMALAKARLEEGETFRVLAEEWVAKNEREGMADITLSKIRWLLDKAYPKIGNRPISKITAQEVLAVLRTVEATGRYESARRMRSVLGRVFRYGIATARAERDPTADLRGALTVPKPKHLAAITTPKRAGDLMRAIEAYSGHAITLYALRLGDKRYRVMLDSGNHFYLAGIWEPAMGEWPLSYRIVTVPANPEVAQHQERHGAIIHRRQVMQWLDGTVPQADLLVTPPARTFLVEEIVPGARRPVQRALAL